AGEVSPGPRVDLPPGSFGAACSPPKSRKARSSFPDERSAGSQRRCPSAHLSPRFSWAAKSRQSRSSLLMRESRSIWGISARSSEKGLRTMAGRYTTNRARVYEELEDALAALDVARSAIHAALKASGYPH